MTTSIVSRTLLDHYNLNDFCGGSDEPKPSIVKTTERALAPLLVSARENADHPGAAVAASAKAFSALMQVTERYERTTPDFACPLPGITKTIKVVFVGHRGRDAGGAERSMQLLLSNLPRHIEISVLLFEDGAYASELRDRGFTVEIVALNPELLAVEREKLPIWAAFEALTVLRGLVAAFRRLNPEIVYTNTSKSHVLAAIAGRLAGYRVVSHYRDIMGGVALTLLRTVAMACTRQRIAISKAVLKGIALPKTLVVPNPLDLSQYRDLPTVSAARNQLGVPDRVPMVAIIGRINRWKGHDRFLRIAKFVAEKSDAHFMIVGKAMFRDADYPKELLQMAADLGIAERVHFVPWLDDPRVAYAAIDVNCNTSRAEPFGRTIIEAAACGVPTVAFDEGGAPEAIGDGAAGRIIESNDEAGFAQAILELLSGDRERISAQARKHSELFDAVLHGKRITTILESVVAPRRQLR